MEKALFSITCATCRARLGVRSEAAIGAILECPKCGSFVEVVPPEGWVPPTPKAAPPADAKSTDAPAGNAPSGSASPDRRAMDAAPAAGSKAPAPNAPAPKAPAAKDPGSRPPESKSPVAQPPGAKGRPSQTPGAKDRSAEAPAAKAPPSKTPASKTPAAKLPTAELLAAKVPATQHPATESPAEPAAAATTSDAGPWRGSLPDDAADGADAQKPVAMGLGVSAAEMVWRKRLLFGGIAAAGLVVVIGIFSLLFSGDAPPEPADAPTVPVEPGDDGPPTGTETAQLDDRWLPDGTTLWFSLRPAHLAGQAEFPRLTGQVAGRWDETAGAVIGGLGLKPEAVRRLNWAATDLAAWPEQSVVVLELEPGFDPSALAAVGEPIDLELAGTPCRRLSDTGWDHPWAVIDGRTIVTGPEGLLRELAGRSERNLKSPTLERLLPLAADNPELTFLVDLVAARAAGWRSPTAVLDVWPEGEGPWHVVWEMADGLGCRWPEGSEGESELVLVCGSPTEAEQVNAALDDLVPAARGWLAAQVETLAQEAAAEGGDETAYLRLLKRGLAVTQKAQWKVLGPTVWLGVDWQQGPSALAAAVVDGRPAIRAAWLAAARQADEAHHRRLLVGLGTYEEAEGQYPSATAGAAELPAEEQLSWLAELLPYIDHADWQGELDFERAWDDPANRPVAQRPLAQVVNPALGPSQTDDGFPVTHYVGVAGVGPDAAQLGPDDPRAGVFGEGRHTRPEDIADGAANTIATLGVSGQLGPWAAGGSPTVRPLTAAPYVDGPDGFGSGQPDGMLAGMADGSVRFLSRDIDPKVLEQMATINGDRPGPIAANGTEPDGAGTPDEPPVEPVDTPPAQPELVRVDVEARLADPLPGIELKNMPLAEAVGLLSSLSGVPMTFDPEAMRQLGVTLRDPVSVDLSDATMDDALRTVLSSRGMAAVVGDGQVLLTSPADFRERVWQRRYTVTDLIGDGAGDAAGLAALVETMVTPRSWQAVGGPGKITVDGSVLDVMQTGAVHDQILTFCERLRVARGKPLRSRLDPARFSLVSGTGRAKATLGRRVTANFHEPTPLIEVLGYLGRLAEADVLLDRVALADANLSGQSLASVVADEQPFGAVLDALLEPLGLGYRVVDAQILQVSTAAALAARGELEFYQVASLLGTGRTGDDLIEQVEDRVAPTTWTDAGGQGEIYFDQPSGCLIVLQSPPVQAELERLLDEL